MDVKERTAEDVLAALTVAAAAEEAARAQVDEARRGVAVLLEEAASLRIVRQASEVLGMTRAGAFKRLEQHRAEQAG